MDGDIPTGHGVEDEPHFGPGSGERDDSDEKAAETLQREAAAGGRDAQEAMHSVFEESHSFLYRETKPGDAPVFERDVHCARCGRDLYGEVRGAPCPSCGHEPARVWRDWYERRRSEVSVAQSWMLIVLVGVFSGPLAILGTFVTGHGSGVLRFAVFGPTIEEMLKVGFVAILVETRPYLLRSAAQIRLAAIAAALAFATVENFLYIFWYLDDPTETIIRWRWSICTALHVIATMIAAEGISRVWSHAHRSLVRPEMGRAFRWLVAAIVVHGSYNAGVFMMERSGFEF